MYPPSPLLNIPEHTSAVYGNFTVVNRYRRWNTKEKKISPKRSKIISEGSYNRVAPRVTRL